MWGREGVIPTGGYPCALPPENWSARGSVREASAYRAVPQPERQQTSCKSEEPTGKRKEATSMELMAGKSCAGTWGPRADQVAWMWRGDYEIRTLTTLRGCCCVVGLEGVSIAFPIWGPEWPILPGGQGQGERTHASIREGRAWVTIQLVISDPLWPTGTMT